MPRVAGVERIPQTPDLARVAGVERTPQTPDQGYIKWNDFEDRLQALKEEMMQEIHRVAERIERPVGHSTSDRSCKKQLLALPEEKQFEGLSNSEQALFNAVRDDILSEIQSSSTKRHPISQVSDRISFNDMRSLETPSEIPSSCQKDTSSQKEHKQNPVSQSSGRISFNDMRSLETFNDGLQQAILETGDVAADTWGFRGTCWDAAAFVADTSMMLGGESLVVVFLCLLSLVVQGLFIAIVFLSLASSPLDEDTIDGFHLWRTNVGHDISFINYLTLESLASRVCRGDSSLHLSDRQVQRVKEIDDYLDNNAPFNGPMMCLLAMLTWILTVAKEFLVLKDMWRALTSIPIGEDTIFELHQDKLALCQIRSGRLRWIWSVCFVRGAIAGSLLFAGLLFLAATYSIEDILLNAVALEFVLNVDELLYQSLAPVKTRKMLLLMKGIPLKRKKCVWKGIDIDVPVTMTFSFGILVACLLARLMPEINKMRDAKSELCDGFLDFSYASAEFGLTMWNGEFSSVQEKMDRFYATNRYDLIRDVIDKGADKTQWANNPMIEDHKASALVGPGLSVQNFGRQSQQFFDTMLNPRCEDLFYTGASINTNPGYSLLLNTVWDAVQNRTVTLCTELTQYCHLYTHPGPLIRWFCPVTCGCTEPGGPLALPHNMEGCPSYCPRTQDYIQQQSARLCTEPPSDQLVMDEKWKQFGANYAFSSSSWGDQRKQFFSFASTLFLERGCGAISFSHPQFDGAALCLDFVLKNLAFWCPLACGCNTTQQSQGCPQSCAINTPILPGSQLPSDL